MNEPISDRVLVERMAAGEAGALEELYDRHARAVLAVLVRIVGDRQVAEDLLQEAMFRVWQHAGRFDANVGAVLPWLLTIAHNLALNELRRRRRHPHDAPPAYPTDESWLHAIPDPTSGPADVSWEMTRRLRLSHALAKLNPVQRDILTLYASGFSQSEIATRLDQPLGTVKTRMRRALLLVRETLRREGYDLE